MSLTTTLKQKTYQFSSIKEVLCKASELKSGDVLAGIAANTHMERIAAKSILSQLTIHQLTENPSVSYESDAITRLIQDDLDKEIYQKIKNWSLSELREWVLEDTTSGDMILKLSHGLTSEVISGLSKLMGNLDLIYASRKIQILSKCNTQIGGPHILASRLQPNHPTDDLQGILYSALYGLSYGVGDALIGINPANDSVDNVLALWELLATLRDSLHIPTQTCVLAHISRQLEALEKGGHADVCFQSIAGSQKACSDFGINLAMLDEADKAFKDCDPSLDRRHMYFETGQGSELSSSAHYDTDQVTMECRCYGLARHYDPFLVNTVVGFIGPEYIYDSKQLIRAGLEDVFNGHLHGLPMGCDVCYTNHMLADQNDNDTLALLLAQAGCHYFMGLPQGDDIMLMYQSTSFHDIAALRQLTGKRPTAPFEHWLQERGFWMDGHLGPNAGNINDLYQDVKGGLQL